MTSPPSSPPLINAPLLHPPKPTHTFHHSPHHILFPDKTILKAVPTLLKKKFQLPDKDLTGKLAIITCASVGTYKKTIINLFFLFLN